MISSIFDAGSALEAERPSLQTLQRALPCSRACLMDDDPHREKVKARLLAVLNDTADTDIAAQEEAMKLLANLAVLPANSSWVLDVLGDLNADFEAAFKVEELWSIPESGKECNGKSLPPLPETSLHTWMALALIRVMGQQLKASHILQMTDGSIMEAVANLISVCKVSGDGSQPDADTLMVHGARLLFELTTFDATFDEEVCDSFSNLKKATSLFRRQNNELIGAVLRLPLLDTFILIFRDRVHECNQPTGRDLALSIKYSLMMLHNLLLYCTERSTQLRKHIATSRFVPEVLDAFLSSTLELRTWPADEHINSTIAADMRVALRIICVATHKVGQLQQHYLKSGLLLSSLVTLERLAPETTTKDIAIFARIACNIDCPPCSGGLLSRISNAICARDESCKESIRRYFWQESSVVPVTRTSAAHQRLSAKDIMGTKPPAPDSNIARPEKASKRLGRSSHDAAKEMRKDQPSCNSAVNSSPMTSSQKNRRRRQRRRAKLRAEHAKLIGLINIEQAKKTVDAQLAGPQGMGTQKAVDEEDDIPEELPDDEESADGPQCPSHTRRIVVRPKKPSSGISKPATALGEHELPSKLWDEANDDGSASDDESVDSDFDIDNILQEIGDVGVQLLSSEQDL